ncbi:hypothetical protein BY996DRAFT_4592161 [Phakopsora pachyrhizi]|nr:hypothetical protein BY996DRAFT_4592161 [Phakopsora pachyrhizi]CAH7684451.1 hypothetical protein PPACK8108_LOCUS18599 [Phakopsora pachyrhizi]
MLESLRTQLQDLQSEKSELESQYNSLLGKLTTMRNTLGDKLRKDAEELDKREQQINQLQAHNEELFNTTETLRSELISSNEENDQLQRELDQLRKRMSENQKMIEDESYDREERYRESREEIERLWNGLEEKKQELMNETVRREDLETRLKDLELALESTVREIESLRADRDSQAESASNLQSVLEEFQSAKNAEIQLLVSDTQNRLIEVEKELKLYKERYKTAEARLESTESDARQCESLKKELKEKNLMLGKVRHEAVILNEHLTEALRRLRKDANEHSVDRRLVTNILLSFILTPREDTKRFEMLSLLASILSWDDDVREQVGLKRSSSTSGRNSLSNSLDSNNNNGSRRIVSGGSLRGMNSAGIADGDGFGDRDTITDQWVSFLLRESNAPTSNTNNNHNRDYNESSIERSAEIDDNLNRLISDVSLGPSDQMVSPKNVLGGLNSHPNRGGSLEKDHLKSSGSNLTACNPTTRKASDSP